MKSRVFDTCIADHRLNYTVLKLSKTRVPPKTREIINWKECNQLKFKEELSLVPWQVCNVFNDIDDSYWMVETLYKNASQELLPKSKAKLYTRSLPWMNGEIRRLMNKRYKQLKKAQQTKDPKEYDKYKILRNKVNIELKRAESQYWKKLLKIKDKRSKDFWKVIKKMTGRERKVKRMGPLIDSNNKLVNEKAEIMNKFFSTIGQELLSNFKTLDHGVNIPNTNTDTCITDIHIPDDKFYDKFRKLKPGKAYGADEIKSREMKIGGEELENSIANITRSSITGGKYPIQWEIGKMKTIYKYGKIEICGNYRPLTMLNIPSKVSEAVICESFNNHLAKVSQSNQ